MRLLIETEEGDRKILDSMMEKVGDFIDAETDDQGVVRSSLIFESLEDHLARFKRKDRWTTGTPCSTTGA